MIKVMIHRHNNEYSQIVVTGHAEYENYGKDIICAATSALVINAANSIEEYTDDLDYASIDSDSGVTTIRLKEHPCADTNLLVNSLLLGLNSIKKQYGKKYLSVNYKEV